MAVAYPHSNFNGYVGAGGGSHFAPRTTAVYATTLNGVTGRTPGGGARGANTRNAEGAVTGAAGGAGVIYLTEFY